MPRLIGSTTGGGSGYVPPDDGTVTLTAVTDGTTDNASALASAAATMVNTGKKTLILPPGDIAASSWPASLNSIDGFSIRGAGSYKTRLLVTGWSGFNAFIKPAGTYGTAISLTADATVGSSTLALSTTGLAVGDTLLVGCDTAFSVENPTRYKGEQVRVKSIDSGAGLTIFGYLRDTYTTGAAASVQKVTPLRGVHMSGFTLVNTQPGTNTAKGIELEACHNVLIQDVHTQGMDGAGVALTNCLDFETDTQHRDHTDDAANSRYGYGIQLVRATQQGSCRVIASRVRHAFDADSNDNTRGVVRDVVVTGEAEQCTSGAWDTHANSENIVFDGVSAKGCAYMGVQFRGKRCKVVGGDIAFCQAGVIASDDADGFYVGGGTTIRDIQDGNSLGTGIRIAAPRDGTVEAGVVIERVARRGISIAGAAKRLKIRNILVANAGIANVSGFKSAIATDGSITNSNSELVIERNLFLRDSTVAPNMDAGVKQQSTGWSGHRVEGNVAHNTDVYPTDSATTLGENINNYRLDQKTPANFPNGVTLKSKAGVITDADWPTAPPNGTVALQRKRLVSRVAGIWEPPAIDRDSGWTAGVTETYSRLGSREENGAPPLVSGRLHLFGARTIPADTTCANITFESGTTAAVTPTNQWFCIVDATSLVVLAVTVDDTTTAWAANAAKTLALSTPFTPTADVRPFLGVCVVAGTVPSLLGVNLSAPVSKALSPTILGASSTGLTGPVTVGGTVSAPSSAQAHYAYARVS